MSDGTHRGELAPDWDPALALANVARAAGPPLLFGLRLWASVCLALYVALWLELDNAYWAGTSAAIVCQPHPGASLRKGWFRSSIASRTTSRSSWPRSPFRSTLSRRRRSKRAGPHRQPHQRDFTGPRSIDTARGGPGRQPFRLPACALSFDQAAGRWQGARHGQRAVAHAPPAAARGPRARAYAPPAARRDAAVVQSPRGEEALARRLMVAHGPPAAMAWSNGRGCNMRRRRPGRWRRCPAESCGRCRSMPGWRLRRMNHRRRKLELSIDRAVPLGLVLNEIATNSIKHAFGPDRGGRISVKLVAGVGYGEARFSVADNGRGIKSTTLKVPD